MTFVAKIADRGGLRVKLMNKDNTTTEMTRATLHTLRSMMGIEATVLSVYDGPPRRTTCDISAVLTLSSLAISGTITLHVSARLANQLAGAMLGDESLRGSSDLTDVTRDAMGEFANIVVGSFKPSVSKLAGEPIRMSVPTVILGKDHVTQTISVGEWSEARIGIDGEVLIIEIVFAED
jgi:CheY-specific phosphatase CheX